jgi:hypothetical protein
MRDTPLANINFAKGDNKSEPVKSVDAFRPKKDHSAVVLLEEWASQTLKPDDPHILKMAIKDNSKTKEQFNNAKKLDRNKFKFSEANFAIKDKDQTEQTNEDLITNPKQNKSKLKLDLVQIINIAIDDILSKAEKKLLVKNEQISFY